MENNLTATIIIYYMDGYIHTYIMIYLVTLASSALAGFHEGRVLQNT
jgi:hypothetical protein